MKNISIATLFSLVIFLSFSCKKSSNTTADSGTFSVTTTAGTTYTTKYVNTPIPMANGTFSLQYQTYATTGTRWMFFVLIDNNNDMGLDIDMPTTIVNGTTYTTTATRTVDLYGSLNNSSINLTKTEVIFEKSTYPGQIKGTLKGYRANNVLYCTGQFDFIAK
jgi:hypothetical protein